MADNGVINSLEAKIKLIIKENEKLASENLNLVAQIESLSSANRELRQNAAALQKRIGVLELERGLVGQGETKRAQARINRLMREIDKCIALINK